LDGVRRGRLFRFGPHAGIGLFHHLLAEIHADQVVLKNVVVEHVLGGFAQIQNPFSERGRLASERHVLRVHRAGGVVVSADSADAAGDEVRVAGIFALHEDAVAAKDRRSAETLRDLFVFEIDLGENPQTSHDAGNRVPVHLDQIPALGGRYRSGLQGSGHLFCPFDLSRSAAGSR
jgi:hypothetical protein